MIGFLYERTPVEVLVTTNMQCSHETGQTINCHMEDPIKDDKRIVPTLHGWTPVDNLFPPCTLEDSHILNMLANMTMHMKIHKNDAFKSGKLNIRSPNVYVYCSLINAHKIKI